MNAPSAPNGKTAANVTHMLRNPGALPRSEATQVEQSRAVAEVQAMVTVAQARRRDVSRAIEAMQQSCARLALAERAFYAFRRGGQPVNGPSVHLARELARCWGNVNYGLRELDRDDLRGQSEMLAFAWDMETNARADTTFIVPHYRDKTGGPVALTDMRDIYENNANNGARRLREQIFATLPVWFREEAIAICRTTLEKGEGDEPLPLRIGKMVTAYASIGIGRERLEQRFGNSVDTMTVVDLANYRILFTSIRNGETQKDEEFPSVAANQVNQMLNPTPAAQPGPATAESGQAVRAPEAPAAGGETVASGQPAPAAPAKRTIEDPLMPEGAGQDEITLKLVDLIQKAPNVDRVKAIVEANKSRTKTWTQANRAKLNIAADDRLDDLQQAG